MRNSKANKMKFNLAQIRGTVGNQPTTIKENDSQSETEGEIFPII